MQAGRWIERGGGEEDNWLLKKPMLLHHRPFLCDTCKESSHALLLSILRLVCGNKCGELLQFGSLISPDFLQTEVASLGSIKFHRTGNLSTIWVQNLYRELSEGAQSLIEHRRAYPSGVEAHTEDASSGGT